MHLSFANHAVTVLATACVVGTVNPAASQSSGSEDDVYWDNRFFSPVAPSIDNMVIDRDGTVFVEGGFSQIGGVAVDGLASWDGGEWHPVPQPFDESSRSLWGILKGGDGLVYGVGSGYVARWDGGTWSVFEILDDSRYERAAVASDGTMYAAGGWQICNLRSCATTLLPIQRWSGDRWTEMPDGDFWVWTLAIGPTDELFGVIHDGQGPHRVRRWDEVRSRWVTLGSLFAYGNPRLWVHEHAGVYYAGWFSLEGVYQEGVARWDGSYWQVIRDETAGRGIQWLGQNPSGEPCIASSPAAGRAIRIECWDGTEWDLVDDRLTNVSGVKKIGFDAQGRLYAAGSFAAPAGPRNLARLSGGSWEGLVPAGLGVNGGVRDIQPLPDGRLLVTGDFTRAGPVEAPGVVVWDTTGWEPWISEPEGRVYSRTIGTGGGVYVGGHSIDVDGMEFFVARFHGTGWTGLVDEMTPKGWGTARANVDVLAIGPDGDLYVAGDFETVEGIDANNIAHWDGEQWNPLGSGLHSPDLFATRIGQLVFDEEGDLFVTGRFARAGDIAVNGIARWDGVSWNAVGSGSEVIGKLKAIDGSLLGVEGGWESGGWKIVELEGENWMFWSGAMDSGIWDFETGPDGDLFVGGSFIWAGDTRADRVARRTVERWESLGSGVSGSVSALEFDRAGALLVGGGGIRRAGGGPAYNVARWTKTTGVVIDPPAIDPLAIDGLVAMSVYPNPAGRRTVVGLEIARPQLTRLKVFDVLGREVATIHDGLLEGQSWEFPIDVRSWPAGVYVVSAVAEDGRVDRSFVLVH